MAFSAVTPQATVQTAYEAIRKAELLIAQYLRVNNPGILADVDAALTAAKTAITNVQV